MSLIYCYKDLGKTMRLTVRDANDDAITPGANDKLRVIICRKNEDPVFTITSGEDTENGSSLTKNSPTNGKNTLRLDASDLTFPPGVYTFKFEYFDNADEQEWKNIDRQVFNLI